MSQGRQIQPLAPRICLEGVRALIKHCERFRPVPQYGKVAGTTIAAARGHVMRRLVTFVAVLLAGTAIGGRMARLTSRQIMQ